MFNVPLGDYQVSATSSRRRLKVDLIHSLQQRQAEEQPDARQADPRLRLRSFLSRQRRMVEPSTKLRGLCSGAPRAHRGVWWVVERFERLCPRRERGLRPRAIGLSANDPYLMNVEAVPSSFPTALRCTALARRVSTTSWRRPTDLNRVAWICSPVPDRSARPPWVDPPERVERPQPAFVAQAPAPPAVRSGARAPLCS